MIIADNRFKTKLFLLSIIPVAIIFVLSLMILAEVFKNKNNLETTYENIKEAESISKVIHFLQLERALSIDTAIDKNSTKKEMLLAVRKNIAKIAENPSDSIKENLSEFIKQRDSTDINSLSSEEIEIFFSRQIAVFADKANAMPSSVLDLQNRNLIQAYTHLASMKESLGKIRAILNRSFIKKEVSNESFVRLKELFTTCSSAENRFEHALSSFERILEFYETTVNQNKIKESFEIINDVLNNKTEINFEGFSPIWFQKITYTIDGLKAVEEKLFSDAKELIRKKRLEHFYETALIIISLSIAVIALIYESIAIIKDILVSTNTLEQNFSRSSAFLEQYSSAIDESAIVSKTDKDGVITYVNEEFCKTSGYKEHELVGRAHNIIKHPDMQKSLFADLWHTIKILKKPWCGEIKNLKKDGTFYWVKAYIKPILDKDGEILEYIGIRTDITEIVEQKSIFEKEAKTDALTKHGNRYKLNGDISDKNALSLALFNIDGFRQINDFYGHTFGDRVIRTVADKIYGLVKKDKELSLYRLQGDEFALLAKGYGGEYFVFKCKDILLILNNSFCLEDKEFDLSCSCGVSFEKENLLTSADMALKIAKRKNRSLVIYDKDNSLDKEYENNIKCARKISVALQSGKFTTFYQPIVNNDTFECEKYESLIRMVDEENKIISPFFFLDVAKKTKKYFDITQIVIRQSFETFKDKEAEFSINLSVEDILNRSITAYIFNMLDDYGIGSRLVFEIVESEYIKSFEEVLSFIMRAKSYGCKIAIDDFGTGYSNFEYLIKLKADYLKIDGSLIKNIDKDQNSFLVVSTIVEFAKKLGMKTIAEFVENENIFTAVKDLGIDYSQGYYFSAPKKELLGYQPVIRE